MRPPHLLGCRWGPGPFHASSLSGGGGASCNPLPPLPAKVTRGPLGWGFLKEADAGPHTRQGQLGQEPLSDGATSFSKCAPMTLVTSVLYLLPGVSEAEGGVCKSVSLATIIQPFPNPSPSLEHSVFSGNPESRLCGAVRPPPALSRAGDPGACVCCEG